MSLLSDKSYAEANTAIELVETLLFLDVANTPIKLGSLVHYAFDVRPEEEWNVWKEDRWGIVTGFAQTKDQDGYHRSIRVTEVDVSDESTSRWHNAEWFVDPRRVRVIH